MAASLKLWQQIVAEGAKGEPIRLLAYSSGARLVNHVYKIWAPFFRLTLGIRTPRAKAVVFAGATVPYTDATVANNADKVANYWSRTDGVSYIFPRFATGAGSRRLAGKGVHNRPYHGVFHGDWMHYSPRAADTLLDEYARDLK